MDGADGMGRLLIVGGVILAAVGVLIVLAPNIPFLGRLPGDIVYHKGGTTFYFPLVTCRVLSVILSLLLSLFRR